MMGQVWYVALFHYQHDEVRVWEIFNKFADILFA